MTPQTKSRPTTEVWEAEPRKGWDRALLSLLSPGGKCARLAIFTFHRVLPKPDPLMPDEPDVDQFKRILEWVTDLFRVIPLDEAVSRLRSCTLPARAAAITFDDGYKNNLELAKPALVAAGLPATVFVARDPVRQGIMWNDLIIEALRSATGNVDLRDLGFGVVDTGVQPHGDYVSRFIGGLKYRDAGERDEIAREIYTRCTDSSPPRHMLTEEEVLNLAEDGITLGAHTLSHPILSILPDDRAFEEIEGSRRWLENLTGRQPTLFAYPNGRPGDDYGRRHAEMVQRAGFSAAVSTKWAAACRSSSIFELPRFTPWERTRRGFSTRVLKTFVRSYARR